MLPSSRKRATVDDLCNSISVGIVVKPTKYYVRDSRDVRAVVSANVRERTVERSNRDPAIETTEKLIENSKAQKKALMQQLLTGKRRVKVAA